MLYWEFSIALWFKNFFFDHSRFDILHIWPVIVALSWWWTHGFSEIYFLGACPCSVSLGNEREYFILIRAFCRDLLVLVGSDLVRFFQDTPTTINRDDVLYFLCWPQLSVPLASQDTIAHPMPTLSLTLWTKMRWSNDNERLWDEKIWRCGFNSSDLVHVSRRFRPKTLI